MGVIFSSLQEIRLVKVSRFRGTGLVVSRMRMFLGDIIHLKILNQHVVVVSSMNGIADLFEKRGSIYSGRYQSVMLTELCVARRDD